MLKPSHPRAESDHETSEIVGCVPKGLKDSARGFNPGVTCGPFLFRNSALRGTGRDKSDRPVVDRTLKCFS
jgi:hypothetical protein